MVIYKYINTGNSVLMRPGDLHSKVLLAISTSFEGRLNLKITRAIELIKKLMQINFQTKNLRSFVVSPPGNSAMKALLTNLPKPGDEVLNYGYSVFSGRIPKVTV